MEFLRGMRLLQSRVPRIKTRAHANMLRSFRTSSCLKTDEKFEDAPEWLKKLKLKQAFFQKDDGLPVFLKKGLPDKILYNFTLGLFIFSFCYSIKVLVDTHHRYKSG